jgi:hypothetical protein
VGATVAAPALIALFGQVIASDRVGGWRERGDMRMGPGLGVGISGVPGR